MRLIDADKLLEQFEKEGVHITFDLPIEEILGEDIDIDDFSCLVQDAIQAYRKMVIDVIKNQNPAYDVGKVMEQMRRLDEKYTSGFQAATTMKEKMLYSERMQVMSQVIRMVRNGGLAEDSE